MDEIMEIKAVFCIFVFIIKRHNQRFKGSMSVGVVVYFLAVRANFRHSP